MNLLKHILFVAVITAVSWSAITDGCDLPDSGTTGYLHLTADGSVLYKSLYDMGGFQFTVEGATVNGASGGDTAASGLLIQNMGSIVLAFSLSSGFIPAGCGTLVELVLDGDATGLTEIVVADQFGGNVYFEYYAEIEVEGCTDESACNYDPDVDVANNDSCTYPQGTCNCNLNPTGDYCDCFGSIENSCGDCGAPEPDYGYDCYGNCDPDLINCGPDCFGVDAGTGQLDGCYQCIDCSNPDYLSDCSSHPAWNVSCTDCHGDVWGSAFVDACKTCVAGNTTEDLNGDGYLTDEEDLDDDDIIDAPIPACFKDCDGILVGPTLIPYAYNDCGQACIEADPTADCTDYCDDIPGNDDGCFVDCFGIWGGEAEIDFCGHCVLGETGQQPCTPDCEGEWGGDAEFDDCGVCSGGDTDHVANSDNLGCGCFQPGVSGCDNTCGSTLENDDCDVCGGSGYNDNCNTCDDDPTNDCMPDCNGEWGGPLLDTCFNYTYEAGEVQNEANCVAGGGYWSPLGFDECGICDGPGIPAGDCDCFGHVIDECGDCNGEKYFTDSYGESCTRIDNISNQPACEDLGGYWSDTDGDEVGDVCISIPGFDCFYRGDEDYCDCSSHVMDECGVCGGGGANLGETGCCETELDDCGVCFGYGEIYECGCTGLPDGYCDCEGEEVIDCAGYCGGGAVEDICGVCDGNGTSCEDCLGNIVLPGESGVQNDCLGVCGGDAVYDCRYGDSGFDQSDSEVATYCNGALLDLPYALTLCYGYDNNGEWGHQDSYNNGPDCVAAGYLWMNAGSDPCGVCNGPGPVYGLFENCCEDDLDECFVCGAGIGDTGPGLSASGTCGGDVGCDEFTNDENACEDEGDDLTCYWGPWCDCSGSNIEDCNGNCSGLLDYIGDQGTFGYDACGICEGDGAIYGRTADCCEVELDDCNTCSGNNTTGFADPNGVPMSDDSIYCDCDGNVKDCFEECGGSESLIGTGVFECQGGDMNNDGTGCESSGIWIKRGNDCVGECDGKDFHCFICPKNEDYLVTPFTCDEAVGNFGCDQQWGTITIADACPESCYEGACVWDDYDNECHAEEIDVCGLCFGAGVGDNYCDCFDNITNCADICPTAYMVDGTPVEDLSTITGNPGSWMSLEGDYDEITGVDLDGCTPEAIEFGCVPDGDGICDDVDDCISSGAKHLIFTDNGSIMDTTLFSPSVCLDVCIKPPEATGPAATKYACENLSIPSGEWYDKNYNLDKTECNQYNGDWVTSTPNPASGGYDLCGVCDGKDGATGDGFSCGFEAEGGFKEINLSWNRPNMGGLEDLLGDTTMAELGLDDMNFDDAADMSYSLYNSSTTVDLYTCQETPSSMPSDTTIVEYGLYSSITPSVSVSLENVDFTGGTLDIYMTNIPSCSYCEDMDYNNSDVEWWGAGGQKQACEAPDSGNSTWIVNKNLTESECAAIPSNYESGGWWFDGNVTGGQFFLTGITVSSIYGGVAENMDLFDFVSPADCDGDGTNDPGCNVILYAFIDGQSFIQPATNQLVMSVDFTNFNAAGICFGATDKPNVVIGNWSGPVLSDRYGDEVIAEYSQCICTDDNPSDDCGVCGGIGVDQGCGCGLPGNCEQQPGACDCRGRMPSTTYSDGSSFICWDEAEVCDFEECSPDPNAVSYNIYHKDVLGNFTQLVNGLSYNHYTPTNLGYEEEHCYAISYLSDINQNGQFDLPEEELYKPINSIDFDAGDKDPILVCSTTSQLIEGCIYASACNYDENANYYDGSCWWPTYGCDCDDLQDSITDQCGVCDTDETNDCPPDCYGAWGGTAVLDECGVCDNDPTNDGPEENYDCDGDCAVEIDCAGECDGELLGSGIFECYSMAGDSIAIGIMDSTACVDAVYIWHQIGNDECGVCDGLGPVEGFDCAGNALAINNGLIPEEYSINNIYPNPFNPVTNIEFGLPENAYVKIVVYDIQGRQVTTLMNSFQFAGYYSINWNATAYSSGVYFIRMMTDTFEQTKQVVLMK